MIYIHVSLTMEIILTISQPFLGHFLLSKTHFQAKCRATHTPNLTGLGQSFDLSKMKRLKLVTQISSQD